MQAPLRMDGVTKSWPGQHRPAVSDLTLSIDAGEVVGLVGPNGAGKSTTLGMVSTRVRPDAGRVVVAGFDASRDPHRVRGQLAVVPQRANLDRSLTARQVLTFHGSYFGMSRVRARARADELLDAVHLADRSGDRTDTFSGGMAQRLLLARALMHDPLLLALDEPTTGLDPQARRYLRDSVRTLADRGVGVLLCSHDIAEVEQICDRVGVLHQGRLLAFDDLANLRRSVPGGAIVDISLAAHVAPSLLDAAVTSLRAIPGIQRVDVARPKVPAPPGDMLSRIPPAFRAQAIAAMAAQSNQPSAIRIACVEQAEPVVGASMAALADCGAPVGGVRISQASLEDIFFQLTGEGL
jgi:ABC-2 type transport system ATP-binding protein